MKKSLVFLLLVLVSLQLASAGPTAVVSDDSSVSVLIKSLFEDVVLTDSTTGFESVIRVSHSRLSDLDYLSIRIIQGDNEKTVFEKIDPVMSIVSEDELLDALSSYLTVKEKKNYSDLFVQFNEVTSSQLEAIRTEKTAFYQSFAGTLGAFALRVLSSNDTSKGMKTVTGTLLAVSSSYSLYRLWRYAQAVVRTAQ